MADITVDKQNFEEIARDEFMPEISSNEADSESTSINDNDLKNLKQCKILDMAEMFRNCEILTPDYVKQEFD
jgi:hypothetical protein